VDGIESPVLPDQTNIPFPEPVTRIFPSVALQALGSVGLIEITGKLFN